MTRQSFLAFTSWSRRLRQWLTTIDRPRWRTTPPWRRDPASVEQRTLLRVLSAAVNSRLPPAAVVAELARDHGLLRRRTLERLAARLSAGAPLADAVEQTPDALSSAQTLAVRFGAQSGTLAETLSAEARRHDAAEVHLVRRIKQSAVYVVGVFLAAAAVMTFWWLKLLPSHQEVLREFSLDQPDALEWLVAIGDTLERYWWIMAMAILGVGILFYTARGQRYFHRVWLPRLWPSAYRSRVAEVMRLLAVASRAGRPMGGALSTLARYHYDRRVRGQLLFVRNEVEQGAPLWASMADAGMLTTTEAAALNAAPDASAAAWTLDRLAEVRRRRAADRAELLLDLLQPAATLLLAAAVLFIALASLSPLYQMIRGLS